MQMCEQAAAIINVTSDDQSLYAALDGADPVGDLQAWLQTRGSAMPADLHAWWRHQSPAVRQDIVMHVDFGADTLMRGDWEPTDRVVECLRLLAESGVALLHYEHLLHAHQLLLAQGPQAVRVLIAATRRESLEGIETCQQLMLSALAEQDKRDAFYRDYKPSWTLGKLMGVLIEMIADRNHWYWRHIPPAVEGDI